MHEHGWNGPVPLDWDQPKYQMTTADWCRARLAFFFFLHTDFLKTWDSKHAISLIENVGVYVFAFWRVHLSLHQNTQTIMAHATRNSQLQHQKTAEWKINSGLVLESNFPLTEFVYCLSTVSAHLAVDLTTHYLVSLMCCYALDRWPWWLKWAPLLWKHFCGSPVKCS